jgi:cytochrome b561
MHLRNSAERWGAVSIGLHWLVVLLVIAIAALGLYMADLPLGLFKVKVYALHKSLGLTVLALGVLRLAWIVFAGRPKALAGDPPWQKLAAKLTHWGLYALLLLVPLSGWWYNTVAGFGLRWFGLFQVPDLGRADAALKAMAKERHEVLFYVLAGLVAVHAAAALWHHYALGDHTLRRMLPWRRSESAPSNKED